MGIKRLSKKGTVGIVGDRLTTRKKRGRDVGQQQNMKIEYVQKAKVEPQYLQINGHMLPINNRRQTL